jgi:group I intron endonuclease
MDSKNVQEAWRHLQVIIYAVYKNNSELVYVGMTKNFPQRLKEHKYHTSKTNYVFGKAIRKYGFDTFTFAEVMCCFTYEDLKDMERYFIKTLNPRYNMTMGGEGNRATFERNLNLSMITKEMWKNPSYRESHISHTRCKEYRKRCSERLKARFKEDPEYRKKLDRSCYNEKYHTDKIIDSKGTVYESVEMAAKLLNCRQNCLTRVLSGTRHTFRNLQFAFLTDYQLHGFKQLPKNCGYKTKGVLCV